MKLEAEGKLYCAVCLALRSERLFPPITIMDGLLVCVRHARLVASPALEAALLRHRERQRDAAESLGGLAEPPSGTGGDE